VPLRTTIEFIILVKPIPPELIRTYLDKVSQKGGAAALADAIRVLQSMDTSPPDCQRTLVHSRLGKQRMLCLGGMTASDLDESELMRAGAAWVAIWSDFTPGNAFEASIYKLVENGPKPVHILTSGSLSVSIYHVDLPGVASRR